MSTVLLLLIYCSVHFIKSSPPSTLYWNTSVSVPVPLYNAAYGTDTSHQYLYIIGGLNSSSNVQYHSHAVYQFNGSNFKQINTINLNQYSIGGGFPQTTTVNDIIYFMYESTPLFRFNTTSLQFEESLPEPTDFGRNGARLASNDTHLFNFGCTGSSLLFALCLYIYDIEQAIWYKPPKIAELTDYFISAPAVEYFDHTLYVFGGEWCPLNDTLCNKVSGNIMKYYDDKNEWKVSNATLTYDTMNAQVIKDPSDDGIFYIFGGMSYWNIWSAEIYDVFNVFDAKTERIHAAEKKMLFPSVYSMFGFVDGRLYVFGGRKDAQNIRSDGQMTSEILINNISTLSPTLNPTDKPLTTTSGSGYPTIQPSASPTVNDGETKNSNSGLWVLVGIIGFIVLVVVIVYIIYQVVCSKKGQDGIKKLQEVILLDVQNDVNNVSINGDDNVEPDEQEGVNAEYHHERRDTDFH